MVIQVLNPKLGILMIFLMICHYTVIKTMFTYFVYGSLGREDGCRCDRNT